MDVKSKKELYIERHQKWMKEKRKEKENRLAIMSAKKGKPLVTSSLSSTKAPVQANKKPSNQSVTRRPLIPSPTNKMSKARKSLMPSTSKPPVTKPNSRPSATNRPMPAAQTNRTSTGSSKSHVQSSSSSSKRTSSANRNSKPPVQTNTKTTLLSSSNKSAIEHETKVSKPSSLSNTKPVNEVDKYKTVKSRLFDFHSKPKSGRISSVGTHQKSVPEKSHVVKTGVKQTFKRRHSMVSGCEVVSKRSKKPAGILKRKSCFGSLDLTTSGFKDDNWAEKCEESHGSMAGNSDDVFTEVEVATVATPGNTRVRFISPDVSSPVDSRLLRKTPAVRRSGLNDWLKAKGKTPSKFRHLMCFHGDHDGDHTDKTCETLTKCSLSADELTVGLSVIQYEQEESKFKTQLNNMLEECMTLYEAGCPSEAILPWLDDIAVKIPYAKSAAQYYKCRAEVIKSTLDLDAVLKMFEEATINNAQPGTELAKCLTETIKYVTEEKVRQARGRSRSRRRSQIQEENIFESSTVAYCVTEATPLSASKKRSSSRNRASTGGTPVQVVTPVRRSTRRSLQCLPDSLRDRNETFASLQQVRDKEGDNLLFHPNLALDSVLAEAVN